MWLISLFLLILCTYFSCLYTNTSKYLLGIKKSHEKCNEYTKIPNYKNNN